MKSTRELIEILKSIFWIETRKDLIHRLGTREDGNFPLYNLSELQKLIEAGNNKLNWHCLGRKTKEEGIHINHCVYAYNVNKLERCTADCKFYKKLHPEISSELHFLDLGDYTFYI